MRKLWFYLIYVKFSDSTFHSYADVENMEDITFVDKYWIFKIFNLYRNSNLQKIEIMASTINNIEINE